MQVLYFTSSHLANINIILTDNAIFTMYGNDLLCTITTLLL